MLQFSVNDKRCTRCGQCAADCPSRIIRQTGAALPTIAPEQEALCIRCQHCLAICPAAAISILGRTPENSAPLARDGFPRLDQMTALVRGRRSVRRYRDENVDPALLRQILDALSYAPSGVNRHALTFTVIDDKAVMQRVREKVMAELAAASSAGRIHKRFAYLLDSVTAYREQGADIIFRAAPHALIVSAPPDAPCPTEDVALALAYFDLLAQSAGLGTVWWGMLRLVLMTLPELKPLFGLPADHVFYAMLFGPPAIQYARTVQRDATPVRRVAF